MSELQKRMMKSGLPPLPNRPPGLPHGGAMRRKKDFKPVTWRNYFDREESVKIGDNSFHVYLKGSRTTSPALVFLHGGGFSALSWSLLSKHLFDMVACQIVCLDLRGHGKTKTTNDENLSAETLAGDVADVLAALFPTDPPEIILVGHSMGGAIVVHTALTERIGRLAGVVVIDVVEGTAMDALSSMQSFLRGRPQKFSSIEQAVEWCVRSAQIRNAESAKVSMPGQIKEIKSGVTAVDLIEKEMATGNDGAKVAKIENANAIPEEEEEETEATAKENFVEPDITGYTWRIDLAQTNPHWVGWFDGLSEKFLSVPATKLLLLAGIDRLDKALTVGQMQGKFQMQILPQAGHAVHEDVPERVAEILATFLVRNKFAAPLADFQVSVPAC